MEPVVVESSSFNLVGGGRGGEISLQHAHFLGLSDSRPQPSRVEQLALDLMVVIMTTKTETEADLAKD